MVRIPEAQSFGGMRAEREQMGRRVGDLERTDGSQYARALEKIRSLIAGLDAQVAAAIAANSYTKAQIDAIVASINSAAIAASRISGIIAPSQGGTGTANVHSTTGTGVQLQVYVMPDGRITVGASTARLKTDIGDLDVDLDAVLGLPARQFRWRSDVAAAEHSDDLHRLADDGGPADSEVETVRAPLDYGLIAEEAADAGLEFLVQRGSDGLPRGVHYQRLPIVHHEILRAQAAQIQTLTERLERLERGGTDADSRVSDE